MIALSLLENNHLVYLLTLLHSERPKLHTIFAFLSAMGLKDMENLKKKTLGEDREL